MFASPSIWRWGYEARVPVPKDPVRIRVHFHWLLPSVNTFCFTCIDIGYFIFARLLQLLFADQGCCSVNSERLRASRPDIDRPD